MSEIRLGVKARPCDVAAAAEAGFDYVELDLNALYAMDEDDYRRMAAEMEARELYAEVVCGILPKDVRVVGEGVSSKRIHEALDRSFEAARALGAELVIFDCPEARRVPADFDPATACRQLGNFIRVLQAYAADAGVRAALLPLRRSVTDLMRYVSEATLISAMLRLDRVGVAASMYNMAMEAESICALNGAGSLLWHARVSNVLGNRAPKPGDGEAYADFFTRLRAIGYAGRVTCEADWTDFAAEAGEACRCLRDARG